MTLVADHAPTDPTSSNSIRTHGEIDPMRLVVFPARAFLALGWARAGVEKLIDPSWWNGTALRDFLVAHADARLPFVDWASAAIGPRVAITLAVVVVIAELAIAAMLATARWLPPALAVASGLNIAFVAFGAVTPSTFYLVLQLTVLLSLPVRRPTRSAALERAGVGACIVAAGAMAPFIQTLEPHAVIEDPAIMLATLALLAATTLACMAANDSRRGSQPVGAATSETSWVSSH